MKKILITLTILFAINCNAQDMHNHYNIDSLIETLPSATQSYTAIIDSLLNGVDKSIMKTDLLYDRVFHLSKFDNANNKTNVQQFEQMWFEMENSQINREYPLTSKTLSNTVYALNSVNKLPIMFLNLDYEHIDTNAIKNNRLKIENGLVMDDDLTKPSPFILKNLLNIGIIYKTDLYTEIEYQLEYNNFKWEEASNHIKTLKIKIPDIGLESTEIKANNPIKINFYEAKDYEIKWKIEMANGAAYEIIQIIKIKKTRDVLRDTSLCAFPSEKYRYFANRSFAGTDGNYKSYGEVQMYQHKSATNNCSEGVRKPIIFIDGYDDHSTRYIPALYNKYLRMNLNSTDTVSVGDSLRARGFDLYILDPLAQYDTNIAYINNSSTFSIDTVITYAFKIDGGTDYCQRNAYLLQTLITRINDSLLAKGLYNEGIIIIGPSMGGQIARYALADMERSNIQHNVKLFVSFDSPNNGANIAMCLQDYFKYLGPYQKAAEETLNEKLLTKFGQQIIIHQTDKTGSVFDQHWNNTSQLRKDFMDSLQIVGYPTLCRKIALINGSGKGGYFHAPASNAYKFRGWSNYIIANGMIDVKGWYLPEANNIGSWNFKGTTILWFLNFIPIPLRVEHYGQTNTSVFSSLDGIPGSDYNIQKDLENEATNGGFWNPSYFNAITYKQTFIPSASSLGFINPNFDWSIPMSSTKLKCDNKIVFDNYYIPEENEEHVAITKKSYDWIIQEIENGKLGCPTICSDEILGTEVTCINGSTIYSLDVNIPAGCSTKWEHSSNYTITASSNNFVTLKALNKNTNGYVRAIITSKIGGNKCSADRIIERKIIATGNPIITASVNAQQYGPTFAKVCPNVDVFTSYNYNFYVNNSLVWSTNNLSADADGCFTYNTFPMGNCTYKFIISATNSCGSTNYNSPVYSMYKAYKMAPKDTSGNSQSLINVYPNPTKDNWTVEIFNPKSDKIIMKLLTISGSEILTDNISNNSESIYSISSSNLSQGIYLLEVIIGGEKTIHKLIKE